MHVIPHTRGSACQCICYGRQRENQANAADERCQQPEVCIAMLGRTLSAKQRTLLKKSQQYVFV